MHVTGGLSGTHRTSVTVVQFHVVLVMYLEIQ